VRYDILQQAKQRNTCLSKRATWLLTLSRGKRTRRP